MIHPVKLMFLAATVLLSASGAIAAPCTGKAVIAMNLSEAPIKIVRDISLAELCAMSARLAPQPLHPVLGFYAGAVGYVVRSAAIGDAAPDNSAACPTFHLDISLVVVERRIAIASDLARIPCHQRAALDHYRRHAAAASRVLMLFAAGLPPKIGAAIVNHLPFEPRTAATLRRLTETFLDDALGTFDAMMPDMQRAVETKEEIERLSTSCNET